MRQDKEKNCAIVRDFYNRNPFPDFDIAKFSSVDDLLDSAGWFYKLINLYVPERVSVADVGCGTGQFCGLLATKNRNVVGIDFSSTSINKALLLKKKLNLENLNFAQADLSTPCFRKETFEYVFCCGVLHHMLNPYQGFVELVAMTKRNGFIVIGLYNHFGRFMLRSQKIIMRLFPQAGKFIRSSMIKHQLNRDSSDTSKIDSWYSDQYQHPHESVHSIKEVLGWFCDNGVEYVNSFPPIELFRTVKSGMHYRFYPNPFDKSYAGFLGRRAAGYFLKELKWIIDLSGSGGYFLIIGRKTGG